MAQYNLIKLIMVDYFIHLASMAITLLLKTKLKNSLYQGSPPSFAFATIITQYKCDLIALPTSFEPWT